MGQISWVAAVAFLLSFTLGGVPGSGVLVALALMSSLYGRGLQEGYLILLPIAPLLMSVAALLDTTVAALASVVIGRQLGVARDLAVRDFD